MPSRQASETKWQSAGFHQRSSSYHHRHHHYYYYYINLLPSSSIEHRRRGGTPPQEIHDEPSTLCFNIMFAQHVHFSRSPSSRPIRVNLSKVLGQDPLEEPRVKCTARVEDFRHEPHEAVFRFVGVCPIGPRIAFGRSLFYYMECHVEFEHVVTFVVPPGVQEVYHVRLRSILVGGVAGLAAHWCVFCAIGLQRAETKFDAGALGAGQAACGEGHPRKMNKISRAQWPL